MKKLKDMTDDERLFTWADHMLGKKINPELKKRGVMLAANKIHKLKHSEKKKFLKLTSKVVKFVKKKFPKKQDTSVKQKVFDYLDKKKKAVPKDKIAKDLNLKLKSVDYACSALKKKGKLGVLKVYAPEFPSKIIRTYWGIK